jgi:hypothetical protein
MKGSKHLSAIKSTVLFFLTLFPLFFLHKVVHEGGHAFVNLIHRISDTNIYVHPFSFSGYSRPFVDLGVTGNAWYVAAGPIAGVLVPLIIFIPLWKHRSINTLPLVLLFPWAVLSEGLNGAAIFIHNGDFFNLVQFTTLPATFLMIISILLLIIGLFLTISLFPLLGLKPQNLNVLWILPIAMILWALSGFGIANWIAVGSPFVVKYHLADEIIQVANLQLPIMAVVGILLALVYVTFYRAIYLKLPTSLRTETKELAWRDLRLPTVWVIVSVVIGLTVIR